MFYSLRFIMVQCGTFQNTILRKLDPQTIERLRLRSVHLSCGQEVVPHGENSGFVLFLESGIASLTVLFRDGSQVEVGIIGSESLVGMDSLLGCQQMAHGTSMRLAGTGFSCRMEEAREEFARFGQFHDLVLTCMQVRLSQSAQLAGCNTMHDVSQRIPRWLLMCSDRLFEHDISITHEMIGNTLGITRTTVTTALDKLEQTGSIDCRRGHIKVVDVAVLQSHACECYSHMAISKPERHLWNSRPKPAQIPFIASMPLNAFIA